jgi:hypothetical protein
MNAARLDPLGSGLTSPRAEHRPLTLQDLTPPERDAVARYRTWKRFHYGPRQQPTPLLASITRYPTSVLVAGCQRSGTTIMTRIIAKARGFQRFAFTHDDELDAALILAGHVRVPDDRRYCFQTTYLNERYPDYALMRPDQKLIWVLRNPYSVVYSMLYNWKRFALEELYDSCVPTAHAGMGGFWPFGPSLARKAALAYAHKTAQLEEIRRIVGPERLRVIEYDRLVQEPQTWLRAIFSFIGEPYDPAYARSLRADSVDKARRMSRRVRSLVEQFAVPTYDRCLRLVSGTAPSGG